MMNIDVAPVSAIACVEAIVLAPGRLLSGVSNNVLVAAARKGIFAAMIGNSGIDMPRERFVDDPIVRLEVTTVASLSSMM
jgi:hypothetical protein